MTIIRSAYETQALQGYQTRAVVNALGPALINGSVKYDTGAPIILIEGGNSFADAIPAFSHPIVVSAQGLNIPPIPGYADKQDWYVAVDMRPYGKFDTVQHKYVIRQASEYKVMLLRARLQSIWVNDGPRFLRDYPMAMGVFSSWISEQAGRKFGLGPLEQMNLAILAATYYASMFEETFSLQDNDRTRLMGVIVRATGTKADSVLPVLDQIETLNGVSDFLEQAPIVTGSIRLKELNLPVLHGLVFGTWFGGANAKETVASALEHPPTWLALLSGAVTEQSYHNSGLAKITQRSSYRNQSKDFVAGMKKLTEAQR